MRLAGFRRRTCLCNSGVRLTLTGAWVPLSVVRVISLLRVSCDRVDKLTIGKLSLIRLVTSVIGLFLLLRAHVACSILR